MEQGIEPAGQPPRPGRPDAIAPRSAVPSNDDVRIHASAVAAEVGRVRRAVVASAEAHGMLPEPRTDIALAVSEACANVVRHAYPGAATPGPLIVETYCEDRHFVVVVSDEGTGIVPRADSPGMGLGLALIARLAHRLEIGSNGLGGARLTMAFAV